MTLEKYIPEFEVMTEHQVYNVPDGVSEDEETQHIAIQVVEQNEILNSYGYPNSNEKSGSKIKYNMKGLTKMTNVVIVVKDGLITDVFSRNKDVVCEVIDFDTQVESEYKSAEKRLAQIEQAKSYKSIY